MPKVIEIRDGYGDRNLEIWTDLTQEEVDAVPGIDAAYCTYGDSSHMSVYIDPRWTKEFVIGALTHAANAKAAQVKEQIDILADHIIFNIPGEPSQSEGAGDCAIRLLDEARAKIAELEALAAQE